MDISRITLFICNITVLAETYFKRYESRSEQMKMASKISAKIYFTNFVQPSIIVFILLFHSMFTPVAFTFEFMKWMVQMSFKNSSFFFIF